VGQVSQSCQFAVRFTHLLVIRKTYTASLQPFNFNYTYFTNDTVIYNSSITQLNSYKGGVYQQAVSALTVTDPTAYEGSEGGYSIYGFEYGPGTSNAVCDLSHAITI
jgi:hypothetical protein